MNIIEELDNYPQNKLAIILRHGDRDDIPSGEFGIEILLNEKGIERSILFGNQLKNKKLSETRAKTNTFWAIMSNFLSISFLDPLRTS